jgi:hypothetical protein
MLKHSSRPSGPMTFRISGNMTEQKKPAWLATLFSFGTGIPAQNKK